MARRKWSLGESTVQHGKILENNNIVWLFPSERWHQLLTVDCRLNDVTTPNYSRKASAIKTLRREGEQRKKEWRSDGFLLLLLPGVVVWLPLWALTDSRHRHFFVSITTSTTRLSARRSFQRERERKESLQRHYHSFTLAPSKSLNPSPFIPSSLPVCTWGGHWI